jgi:hypothetical protein
VLFESLEPTCTFPTLIAVQCTDEYVGHCISVIGGFIFDSSREPVVCLTRSSCIDDVVRQAVVPGSPRHYGCTSVSMKNKMEGYILLICSIIMR